MRILITGICGSWGKEFTKQLKDDHTLIGIDNSEIAVAKFRHEFPGIAIKMATYGDWDYETTPVDMIIHLAAYKHIDICEENAMSCVFNNVVETYCLFDEARRNGVKILFVSTDKAVEPVSTYGMSKALGEKMCIDCGGYIARSGNIIGSNGSVFQIWGNLIENKKPIKITDPEMLRYFLTVEEAVSAVWEGFMDGKKLNIIRGEEMILSDLLGEILVGKGYDYDYTKYPYGVEIIGRKPMEKFQEKLMWDNEEEK